jgi:hypothetical protein
MPVDMSRSVSIYMPNAMSTTLHRDYCDQLLCLLAICRMLYAKYRMPAALCQVPCASYYEFTVISTYMPFSVSIAICYMSNDNCYISNAICSISQMLCALCQIPYASYCIPTFICRLLGAKFSLWVAKLSLYVNLKYYASNCHILLHMPSALFYVLYAKCYVLYANTVCQIVICQMLWPLLCLLVWLQNTLDISLYMSITRLWLSILLLQRRDYYHTIMVSIYISGYIYFSLPTNQGIE